LLKLPIRIKLLQPLPPGRLASDRDVSETLHKNFWTFTIDREALVHCDPRRPCKVAGSFLLTTKAPNAMFATYQIQPTMENVVSQLKRIGLMPQFEGAHWTGFWFDVSSRQRKAYYLFEIGSQIASRAISDGGIDPEVTNNIKKLDRALYAFILLCNVLYL